MVKKHIKKGKSLTGKSGLEAVKGASGIAASYITRTKAIKKLQVTLKDFRRLCILKGIYPRDPKKKKEGKNKSYYHIKDILYLQHEPLLQHFRDLKIFLRKFHRAKVADDSTKVKLMEESMPVLTLDHLIRERYPNFNLALNDLNEALNLLFLFHHLPQSVLKSFNELHVRTIEQLIKEFLYYVSYKHAVSKVFVSIKGIYVQCIVNNIAVTFLVPHRNTLYLPTDVDYRIMFTFLQFYEVLMKFINYKLFHDDGLQYPPVLDAKKNDLNHGFNALLVQKVANGAGESGNEKADEFVNADGTNEVDESVKDYAARSKLFANCYFLLSREIHADLIELVVRSGGGRVKRYQELSDMSADEQAAITHIVIDRPNLLAMKQFESNASIHYIVPQWVIDSYNLRHLCPVSFYRPGQQPPPHLSPFVDDDKEGYVPKQREILQSWKSGQSADAVSDESAKTEDGDGAVEETEEERYQRELELERKGIPCSVSKQQAEEADDSEDEDEDDAELLGSESDEDSGAVASAPASSIMSEADLPKIMMKKKDAKLYHRIQYGIQRRERANENLRQKRKQAEAAEEASAKPVAHSQKNKKARKSVR